MIDWKVENGDLVIGSDGQFETTTSIAQQVYMNFATFQFDWFYNLTFGVDYQDFKGNLTQEGVNLKVQTKLLSIPGVTGIISFSSQFDAANRFYAFQVEYTTTDSPSNTLKIGS